MNIIFMVLTLISAFPVGAKEDRKVTIVEKLVERDSSAFHRLDKSYTVQAHLFGFGPGPVSGHGLTAGIYLSPDQVVQFETYGGQSEWYNATGSRVESRTLGVYFKQFSGNSFYFKGGVDYTTVNQTYIYSWTTTESGYSYRGSKFAATFVIGNQWQWERFTIGCDWLGWSVPITSNSNNEQTWGNNSYQNEDLRRSKDSFLQNGFPLALHFYLGASF